VLLGFFFFWLGFFFFLGGLGVFFGLAVFFFLGGGFFSIPPYSFSGCQAKAEIIFAGPKRPSRAWLFSS